MGTGSFQGVKRPWLGVDHPPPSSAEVKERVELYLYSPSGPSWPVLKWTLPLPGALSLGKATGAWSSPLTSIQPGLRMRGVLLALLHIPTWDDLGFEFGRGQRFFSAPKPADFLWIPNSLLFSGYRQLFFPGVKVAGVWFWLLSFIWRRDQEWVEPHLCSRCTPTCCVHTALLWTSLWSS